MPNINGCSVCSKSGVTAFDAEKGGVVCSSCAARGAVKMSGGAYRALAYIVSCEDKKMLSFNASEPLLHELNAISEKYVSVQMDRRFASLDYFNAILQA